jgi:uncharacterized membrane protein
VTTRSRRPTIIVLSVCLVASLCLNFFVGGAWLAGRWLDHRITASVGSLLKTYPASIRRDFLHRLIVDRQDLRSSIRAVRDARQHMIETMRTDPIDRQALDAAMADVRQKTSALQELIQNSLAESVARAPAADRATIKVPPLMDRLATQP